MTATLGMTVGAIEVGVLLSCVLYGIMIVQIYLYVTSWKSKDPYWLKSFVSLICLLETIHTTLLFAYLYWLSILHAGQSEATDWTPWCFDALIVIHGFIGPSVQSFFAYRVFILSGSMIVPALAWLGSVIRAIMAFTVTGFMIKTGSLSEFSAIYGWEMNFVLSFSAAVDILNTVALSWTLYTRRGAGSRCTRRMIDRIIVYTVETGFVTSACAVCMLITRATLPGKSIWLGIFMVYPKLYSNSLMVSLNARSRLTRGSTTHDTETTRNPISVHLCSRQTPTATSETATMDSNSYHMTPIADTEKASSLTISGVPEE